VKKWMLGFRTTILGRIYHKFLFADNPARIGEIPGNLLYRL